MGFVTLKFPFVPNVFVATGVHWFNGDATFVPPSK